MKSGDFRRAGMGAIAIVAFAFPMPPAHGATNLPDAVTLRPYAQAAIPVLANDPGDWIAQSVAIVDPPLYGAAESRGDGWIVYRHTNGLPASDLFTYTAVSIEGTTSMPQAVEIVFNTAARIPAGLVCVPTEPPAERYTVVDAFPGITFSAPVSMESPPDDTNQLYVVERAGRVKRIANVQTSTFANLYLDISDRVADDGGERSMKGIAFHPGFSSNGQFFVAYCHTGGTVRLSRFLRDSVNPSLADPESERILIEQTNDGSIHNIDEALFGPDGYLYVGFGDEGSPGDAFGNSQTITNDLWSAILRIDPDKRPGNLEPNPHPAIPVDSNGWAFFSVPADNPFVGATQFNGVAVDPIRVRTEFHSVGYRNPWQFSFDSLTGELWVGDVGEAHRESVFIMPPGGNAGWAWFEGTLPGPRAPAPGGFTRIEPVWEYPHDLGAFGGSAVIGGVVIRTTKYPALAGKYVCADLISSHIWAIDRTGGTTLVERIAGEGGVVQFGFDPATGELLLVDYDEGRIRRLVENTEYPVYPDRLSQTGLFADLADLAPNPGVVPYAINLPFWSDHGIKQRWFAITNLQDGFGFQPEGAWDSSPGTLWVKHFDLELDRGNPSTRRRIETRLLVRTTNGGYGVSYRWNAAQTEAHLVPDMGEVLDLPITNAGVPLLQRWSIPSRAECLLCHNQSANFSLGFDTRQLNRTGTLAGADGPFIDQLAAAGYLTNAAASSLLLPRHLHPSEGQFSVEARARAYLAVNCGYCHRGPGSPVPGTWDGRAHIPLDATGMVRAPADDNGGDTNNLLLVPGSPAHSIIWNRMAVANGFTRMPPLASSVVDDQGIQLISQWITQQLPSWQPYAEWRAARFHPEDSPDGEPEADPDGDGFSNWAEYQTSSDPTNVASFWTGAIARNPDGAAIEYELPDHSVFVEISTNLVDWRTWAAPGNHGIPPATAAVVRLPVPADARDAFYRLRVNPR